LFRIRSIGHISFAIRIVVFEPAPGYLVAPEHLVVEALERGVVPPVVVVLFPASVIPVLGRPALRSLLVRVVPIHVGIGILVSVVSLEVVVVGIVVIVVILIVIILFIVIRGVSSIVVLFVGLGLLVVVMLGAWGLGPLVVVSRWGRLVVWTIAGMLVVRTRRRRLRVGPGRRGAVRWSVLGSGVVGRGTIWSVHPSISSVIVVRRSRFAVLHPPSVMRRPHRWGSTSWHASWGSHRSQWGRGEH